VVPLVWETVTTPGVCSHELEADQDMGVGYTVFRFTLLEVYTYARAIPQLTSL